MHPATAELNSFPTWGLHRENKFHFSALPRTKPRYLSCTGLSPTPRGSGEDQLSGGHQENALKTAAADALKMFLRLPASEFSLNASAAFPL